MPKRKRSNARKRPPFRKARRTYKRRTKVVRMPRPMSPRTYNFTRSMAQTVILNNLDQTETTGWKKTVGEQSMSKQWTFKLNDLPNYSEFVALYEQYRIMAVKQEYYFSDSVASSVAVANPAGGSYVNSSNKQIIMMTCPNAIAKTHTLDENYFMQSQCSKKRLCLNSMGFPQKVYTKVKQLSRIYSAEEGNSDFIKVNPKFISTAETEALHYGIDMRLARVDGQEFSHGGSNYPSVKIITKFYLQFRQVK